jgi:hypothetical protein
VPAKVQQLGAAGQGLEVPVHDIVGV